MSTNEPQMTEEQMRAAYEEEIKKIRVEHVLLENVVTIVNLGMRRTGLMPGTEAEKDPAQVRISIESVKALLPVVDAVAPEQAEAIRPALSQLQMAYVQITGSGSAPGEAGGQQQAPAAGQQPPTSGQQPPATGQQPPPADKQEPERPPSSGRLWIPGQ